MRPNPRWEGNCPWGNSSYSATVYGDLARATLEAYEPGGGAASKPLFFYLPWQNVHSPYQAPKDWTGDVLRGMLASTDAALGGVVDTLKAKGMWEHSVMFYSADNGGTDRGSNWPLRGAKHSNWEGGMRAAAFVSGGRIPSALRGTATHVVSHIADFYATICMLAGVSPTDDSPVAPLPVDPSQPAKDIYSNGAWPAVDGRDLWPALVARPAPLNYSAVHARLWLSTEVLVGLYPIVTS
jgi:arylsulfatase A-like enzyme